MSIIVEDNIIRITGNATVADAEPILAALHDDPSRSIDLAGAAHLHSAVIQILLALRPAIKGAPAYPFFNTHLLPSLIEASEQPSPMR